MADKKITETTIVTSLPDTALVPAVDLARAIGDRNVAISKSNLLDGIGAETGIGTVIDLSNVIGTYYNMGSANTGLTYTTTNLVLGGKARILINTASIPDITGATRIYGHPFTPLRDCYIEIEYNGQRVEYWVKAIEISPEQDFTGLPFGKIIYQTPTPLTDYIGTPGIIKTSTGRIIVTHDIFGTGAINELKGYIYTSDDDGNTFTEKWVFNDSLWINIFEQGGNLYLLYISNSGSGGVSYRDGDIAMKYSTDDGETWSAETTLFTDDGSFRGYALSATPVIERDGYIALGVMRMASGNLWAEDWENTILYGNTTDLTNVANWTLGTFISFNGALFPSTIYSDTPQTSQPRGNILRKGQLEPQLLYDGTNTYLHCRLEQTPNSNYGIYYNVTWNAGNPPLSTISTTPNYHEIAGGNVKSYILWDSVSAKFWSIGNWNRVKYMSDNRYELYLSYSTDLDNWTICEKVGGFELTADWENEITNFGSQYPTFIIDGNDIIYVARSTSPDASSAHDADALSITKVLNFRTSTEQTFITGSLILDENSERLEDVNGIGVILDQSRYQNGAYMLTSENANKVTWATGFNFTGSQYMHLAHNEHLNPDTGTGLTAYVVIENIQNTNGRFLAKSDLGSTGLGVSEYTINPQGMSLQGSFSSGFTDITLANNYIFAYSYDNVNNHIYNFLNGVNRGNPPSKTGMTWDIDHLVVTSAYTNGNIYEVFIGKRNYAISPLYVNGLIKAIHVLPSYTTPANVVSYTNALNAIYSIY